MTSRTLSARAGLAAPLVAWGGIVGAALAMEGFSPTANALSDLGVAGPLPAALFNGGLILAGLLSLAFTPALWAVSRTHLHRIRVVVFAMDAVCLSLVGVFPSGTPQHTPVAMGFYLLLTLVLWVDGAGDAFLGRFRAALLSVGLGAANVLAWVGWAATGKVFRPGLAIPETVGALALGIWTLWRAREALAALGPSA